jgi:hypothetical protein
MRVVWASGPPNTTWPGSTAVVTLTTARARSPRRSSASRWVVVVSSSVRARSRSMERPSALPMGRVGESTHQGVAVAHTQERDFAGHAMGAAIWATAKEQAGADAGAKVDVQEIVDPGHSANAVLGEAGPVDVVVDKDGFPSIEPEGGTKCWHGSGERGVGELANGVGPRVDGCGDGDRGGQAGRSGLATAPTNELAGVGDGTGQILVAGLDLVLTDDLAFVVEGAHCDVAAVERDAEAVAVVRVDVVEQWRAAAITGSLPDFDDDPVGEQALR